MSKLIHKKYHKAIASLLIACTLVMSVPFYGFMHHHPHFVVCELQDTDYNHQGEEFSQQHENIVELHNCIACSISQVAQMFFLKSAESSCELVATEVYYVEKPTQQVSYSAITSQGRAPPIV